MSNSTTDQLCLICLVLLLRAFILVLFQFGHNSNSSNDYQGDLGLFLLFLGRSKVCQNSEEDSSSVLYSSLRRSSLTPPGGSSSALLLFKHSCQTCCKLRREISSVFSLITLQTEARLNAQRGLTTKKPKKKKQIKRI